MDFKTWLKETKELQARVYGESLPKTGSELAEYVRWNILAAHDELSELLACVVWKPWSTKGAPIGTVLDRDNAITEIVDLMHFVANVACAIGVSGREISTRYWEKMAENERRQARGYDTGRKQMNLFDEEETVG